MNYDILITVLSWEERYILALEKNLSDFDPSIVIVFRYNNPLTKDWKNDNDRKTKELTQNKLIEVELSVSKPEQNWFTFLQIFSANCKDKKVILDTSTMTRDCIWQSLYNCKINNCETKFIYYKPEKYPGEWISRDAGQPRLLYKMSGIAKLGAPTLLLVTCGFDLERLDSLIYRFEPRQTMVFLPNGDDDRNREISLKCKALLKNKYSIEFFYEYNPYDILSSTNLIRDKLLQTENGNSECYLDTHNIIFNSLGAKTSAITLFNLWMEYSQVALSYIPSKEYNREYSSGIGELITGDIKF